MSKNQKQAVRQPATKFPNLQKKLRKQNVQKSGNMQKSGKKK